MDGNPLINPVGSLPPQVYWRRRALAGLLAVLVLWFAWSWLSGKSGAKAAQGPSSSAKTAASSVVPGTTASPGVPAATVTTPPAAAVTSAVAPPAAVTSVAPVVTTPPALAACTGAQLKLTASTDHTVYAAGVEPHFVLTVTNISAVDCRIDVGTAARGFLVTSGTDRIWASGDCVKTSPNVVTFKPKESVSYSHDWSRVRSAPTACTTAGAAARPGTYKLVGHVGDQTTGLAVFQLD